MENELYKRMYYRLFNRVTDAINSKTKEETDIILKNAQQEAEEMYMNSENLIFNWTDN